MHRYVVPEWVKERVLRRQGKLVSHDTVDAGRTALIVVDMQNHFVAEGFPAEVPFAKAIVPNINRMAKAVRTAGGVVLWIQTSSEGALKYWARHHQYQLTPEKMKTRIASLNESGEGFKLYPKLDVQPADLRVKKATYSAFMPPGSSDIDAQLKSRGIESVIITGTATNVCCESNARDAMFLDYRVIMLSDGNATWTDDEHAATMNHVALFFGDVMTTDETIAKLVPVDQRKSA
jgi:ureidoacrylate peracid hydrolase